MATRVPGIRPNIVRKGGTFYRGPQDMAQQLAHATSNINNGNPNGAYNNSFDDEQEVMRPSMAVDEYSRRNADMMNSLPYFSQVRGGIDAGGQHELLGRYAPPTVDERGQSTQRGPYSYNLPNAYGGGGINQFMPNFSTPQESQFRQPGVPSSPFMDYIRNLMGPGMRGFGGRPQGGPNMGQPGTMGQPGGGLPIAPQQRVPSPVEGKPTGVPFLKPYFAPQDPNKPDPFRDFGRPVGPGDI